jgi:hypothetical protein
MVVDMKNAIDKLARLAADYHKIDLDKVNLRVVRRRGREAVRGEASRPNNVTLRIPQCQFDAVDLAQRVWAVLIHELGHIRDYRNGAPFQYYRNGAKRRMAHDTRPQERRADNYVRDCTVQPDLLPLITLFETEKMG